MENDRKQTTNISPWLSKLLLSILGTAIGVGLTFFANNMVEKSHQKAAQRETAIMAVCDIDEIVRGLKDEIHMEDSLFKVTMYVSSHQELIDSLSMDTLDMVFKYLYDDPMVVKEWTADTKENAFNSGIDARINIGNNQFYDNVQSCYYARRSLMKVMADAPVFRRPVQKEDYEELLQQLKPTDFLYYNGSLVPDAKRKIMKHILAQESTTLYINRFFSRRDAYRKVINELNQLNRENKLLMDITDKDIEKYIKKYSGNVTASGDLIIGTWEADGNTQRTFIFHKDSTFEETNHFDANFHLQLVEEHEEQEDKVVDVLVLAPTTFHMKGRWELRGDTLINDHDANMFDITSFEADLSNAPQWAKDSMEVFKDVIKQGILEEMKKSTMAQNPEYFVIMFDKTASTMVWTFDETTPAGSKQKTSLQLYRKPE